MKNILRKIFKEVISKEKDIFLMEKKLNDDMERYMVRYKEDFSESDMEKVRDCVYYAALVSEEEGFYLGMKYALKMLLDLSEDL